MRHLSQLLAIAGLACIAAAPAAMAHAPHDVVHAVGLSPAFADDGVVLAYATLLDHRIIAYSSDRGDSWQQVGGPAALHGVAEFAFSPDYATDSTVLVATDEGGVWRSLDGGLTWAASSTGLPPGKIFDVSLSPDFAVDGTALAATDAGLFRSTDGGHVWTQTTTGLADSGLRAVGFGVGAGGTVAFAAGNTVHRSDDLGVSWTAQEQLPSIATSLDISPAFATDSSAIVGTNTDGVLVTADGGAFWRPSNLGLTDLLTTDVTLAADGSRLVTTRTDGVFVAASLLGAFDLDMSAFEPLDPIGSPHYRSVALSASHAIDGVAYVAAFEGLWRSGDGGATWFQLDVFHQLVELRLEVSPRFIEDGLLYVGTYGGGVKVWHEPRVTVTRSPGVGRAPTAAGSAPVLGGPAPSLVPINTRVRPSVQAFGWWEARANGLVSKWIDCVDISPDPNDDQTMFYGYWGGFRSLDAGLTWSKFTLPGGAKIMREVTLSPNYASDQTVVFGSNGDGTWMSTDGGDAWVELAGGLPPGMRMRRIRFSQDYASDGTIFVASWDDKIWRSVDSGTTWQPAHSGITAGNIRGFDISPDFAADGIALAGARGDGLFRTVDGGDTWVAVNDALPATGSWSVEAVGFSPDFAADQTVFMCTMAGGMYRSLDRGVTWTEAGVGLPLTALRDLVVSPGFTADDTVFVATHEGVFRSRDRGDSWHPLPDYVRVDDSHPVVVNEGAWAKSASAGANSSGYTSTQAAGDHATLEFLGEHVVWYAQLDPESVIATIWIDDVIVDQVDLYAPSVRPQQAVFERSFDVEGWHTIRVEHSGQANAASNGAWLRHDGWSYQR